MYDNFQILKGPWDQVYNEFFIKKICDEAGVLSIYIETIRKNETRPGILKFEDHLGYMCFDEGDRMPLWLGDHSLPLDDEGKYANIYVSQHSEFISWAMNQSPGISYNADISHYIITSPDDIIDVLSYSPPQLILK